jgi:hypothetical protein
MANQKKTRRTQVKDLSVTEQELTAAEAVRVKGGLVLTPAPTDEELKTKHDTVKNSINNIR